VKPLFDLQEKYQSIEQERFYHGLYKIYIKVWIGSRETILSALMQSSISEAFLKTSDLEVDKYNSLE
jgi:hypothetical protein